VVQPEAEYAHRLVERRALEFRLAEKHWRLSRGRNAFLALIVAVAWLAEKERLLPLLLVFPVVVFTVSVIWRSHVRRAWRRATNAVAFYQRRLVCLGDRWAGGGEPGTRYLNEAHPYALDLDLFGNGGLFERLCLDGAQLGHDTLAAWLCSAASAQEVRDRQAAVTELRSRLDLREDLALLGADAPSRPDLAALMNCSPADTSVGSRGIRLAASSLVAVVLTTFLGLCAFGTGPFPLLVAILVEVGFALWLRGRIRPILQRVEGKSGELRFFSAVLARLERERFESPRLNQLRAEFDSTVSPASSHVARLGRLISPLTLTPLIPFFLGATQFALAIATWRQRNGAAAVHWLSAVQEIESLCALAAYAYENPSDPFPELVEKGPHFEAEELGHPLLPRGRCVPNSLRLDGKLNVLVVSGSNMSGKSTLLRTVGANIVLALAGAPVRAKRLCLSPLVLGATLRVQDSLQAGRSRFYAEVARVRQLLDLAKGPLPLLFLFDELFSGTNSNDRRLGAVAVVRTLLDSGAIGLLTTHDLALTQLADLLAPRVANVHFMDQFTDGQMTFDYRMRPGVCPSSNGLALMRAVGIVV
jgi:hypothetical protein